MIPLYQTLLKNLRYKSCLEKSFVKKLLTEIPKCSEQDHEIIYCLIQSYCQAENMTLECYPFNSRFENNVLIFNFDDIPAKLQHILFKFVCKVRISGAEIM